MSEKKYIIRDNNMHEISMNKIYVMIAEINRSTNYLGVAKTKDNAETKIRDIFHWAQVEEVAAVDNKFFYKINEHGLITVIEEDI